MPSDDIRRVIRILDDVETNLKRALTYVQSGMHNNPHSGDLQVSESEIRRALSEIDDAVRKLKRMA